MSTSQALSPDQLRSVIAQTLSPEAEVRRTAERLLTDSSKNPAHAVEVLRLVASATDASDGPVRQAAAIHFKNIIKKGWDTESEHGNDGIVITESDRCLIKSHLVQLMCTMPPQIQAQCSEAISIIAAVDFPTRWDNLLSELVGQFTSQDMNVVNGVLLTANSIIKRFRYAERSDELYKDILYVLERLQAPLLSLFVAMGEEVEKYRNDPVRLRPYFMALRTMCRIFYSLNYQDLPEYFEDHMGEWMGQFSKYLEYVNPLLTDEEEENEASPIDTLQAAIVQNLYLYADKDEETFLPYLPEFTRSNWNLLMRMSQFPKHDNLATTCIRFLSSLLGKLMHKNLFQDENALRQIISSIVIPNIVIREIDQERFEDDPEEFIRSDMEENDSDSRRKCSQDLLRAMCRHFEAETTALCMENVTGMLVEFQNAPSQKWTAKDVAIHLFLGIAIQAETSTFGVSIVNSRVNVTDFFSSHVLVELQDTNHTVRPMVKATAIKFVSAFRNQFAKEHLIALTPLLIHHLSSPSVVVHTYSASAIERFLTCKENIGNGVMKSKFGGPEIQPFLQPLFTGLFSILDNAAWNENEYVMKCIMRSLNASREDVVPITQIVLEKLNSALFIVAKNPRNPQFNHYLFESIAVLVKSVCTKNPEYTAAFEALLFPPFQLVLQMDVSEFTPYVFQILAQILEFRSGGLGDAYKVLFPPCLSPSLWDRKGNIPALTRLLQAYLQHGASEIVSLGQLVGLLGVFQKLISVKADEMYGFDLLKSVIQFVPEDAFQPHMRGIFQILLMRLQHSKSPRYVRLVTAFFAQYVGKLGAQNYLDMMNSIQPGLGVLILAQIWLPRLKSDIPVRNEAKIQVVGLTHLICQVPNLLNDVKFLECWSQVLACAVQMISSPNTKFDADSLDDDDVVEIGYDPTFCRLHFATRISLDPFAEIKDPISYFSQSLYSLCSSQQPGYILQLIQRGFNQDPKLSLALESIMKRSGLQLL